MKLSEYVKMYQYEDGSITLIDIESDTTFPLNTQELANIPQVKSLIEAAQTAEALLDEQLEIILGCIPDANTDDNDSTRKLLHNALAPFKCLLVDKDVNNE